MDQSKLKSERDSQELYDARKYYPRKYVETSPKTRPLSLRGGNKSDFFNETGTESASGFFGGNTVLSPIWRRSQLSEPQESTQEDSSEFYDSRKYYCQPGTYGKRTNSVFTSTPTKSIIGSPKYKSTPLYGDSTEDDSSEFYDSLEYGMKYDLTPEYDSSRSPKLKPTPPRGTPQKRMQGISPKSRYSRRYQSESAAYDKRAKNRVPSSPTGSVIGSPKFKSTPLQEENTEEDSSEFFDSLKHTMDKDLSPGYSSYSSLSRESQAWSPIRKPTPLRGTLQKSMQEVSRKSQYTRRSPSSPTDSAIGSPKYKSTPLYGTPQKQEVSRKSQYTRRSPSSPSDSAIGSPKYKSTPLYGTPQKQEVSRKSQYARRSPSSPTYSTIGSPKFKSTPLYDSTGTDDEVFNDDERKRSVRSSKTAGRMNRTFVIQPRSSETDDLRESSIRSTPRTGRRRTGRMPSSQLGSAERYNREIEKMRNLTYLSPKEMDRTNMNFSLSNELESTESDDFDYSMPSERDYRDFNVSLKKQLYSPVSRNTYSDIRPVPEDSIQDFSDDNVDISYSFTSNISIRKKY